MYTVIVVHVQAVYTEVRVSKTLYSDCNKSQQKLQLAMCKYIKLKYNKTQISKMQIGINEIQSNNNFIK